MKKLFCCLLLLGALIAAPGLYAQKLPPRLLRSLLQHPAGKPLTPATRQALASLSYQQLTYLAAQLEKENLKLARAKSRAQVFQTQVFEASRPAVFRALPTANGPRHSFTGTLFEIKNGKEKEIFGAIPMHILQDEEATHGLLSPEFTAAVEINHQIQLLPARVVQISSSKTGDIALVQFPQETQPLLSPLPLAQADPDVSHQVYAQGFACNILTHSVMGVSGHTSAGLLTTQIPSARQGDRAGFCGSALVNENLELAGIHIGSTYAGESTAETPFFDVFNVQKPFRGDEGYAAPASFLRNLVEAYHQPGKKVLPVTVRGQEIIRLQATEYVSRVELLDQAHNVLWQHETDYKVSMRPLETALLLFPQARWIRLHVGQTHWQQNKDGWFVTNDDTLHRVVLSGIPARP